MSAGWKSSTPRMKAGWQHDPATFDGGNIIRDTFTGALGTIRIVWLRTPWSDTGRYAGAIFSEKATHKDRNVWKVTGTDGLLELLEKEPITP